MGLVAEAASRLRVKVDTPKLRDLVGGDRLGQGQQRRGRGLRPAGCGRPAGAGLLRPGDGRPGLRGVRAGEAGPGPDRLRGHPALRRGPDVGACRGGRHHPAHLPPPGRRRVPGRQPAAGGAAHPVAGGPHRPVRGRRPRPDHPHLRRSPGELPDRLRRPVPGHHGDPAGPGLPVHPAGGGPGQHDHRPGRRRTGPVGSSCRRSSRRAPRSSWSRHRTRPPRRPGSPTGWPGRPRPGPATARWPCCSGSTPSHHRSSRRWPTGASPTWSAAASGSTSGPRCGRPCWSCATRPGRWPGTSRTASSSRSRRCSAPLGWTEQPPDGAGAVRERWESLAALVGAGRGPRGRGRCRRRRAWTWRRCRPSWTAGPRPSTCRSPRASRSGTLHSAKGLEWDAVALLGVHEGSLPFVLATTPGAGQRGAPAALRRRHPGAAAAPGVLVPHPQRGRQGPQRLPLPHPGAAGRVGRRTRPRGRPPVVGAPCCRRTADRADDR